jgi:hypothetical protein
MNTKHTPGPWKVVALNEEYVWGNGVTALARVYGTEYDTENGVQESAANVALICAAPELLAACAALLDGLENMTTDAFSKGADKPLRDMAAAAIHNATERN